MSEKIVHVARALARESGHPGVDVDPDFILDGVPFWTLFERQARAAIVAMRDPTTKMIHAAAAAMSPGKRPTQERVSCSQKHAIRYNSMIDEALK